MYQLAPFTYAFITADPACPVETRRGDGTGGLEADKFPPTVKAYFAASQVALTDSEQTQAIENIKRQAKASGLTEEQVNSLDQNALESLAQNASCDIIALVVPMPKNSYTGVSMYINGQANSTGAKVNERATAICRACGHKEATVRGDAFISRYYDNENSDEVVSWARIDIDGDEAVASAEWCAKASQSGGGGGIGGSGTRSLSGMMNSMGAQQSGVSGGGSDSIRQPVRSAPEVHSEAGYTWSQTKDDLEIVCKLPEGTPKKSIDVSITYKHIRVGVKGGETIVSGDLEEGVEEDDSTWTRDADTVTLSLTKKNARLWQSVLQQ